VSYIEVIFLKTWRSMVQLTSQLRHLFADLSVGASARASASVLAEALAQAVTDRRKPSN
jgi:hypothetical protein